MGVINNKPLLFVVPAYHLPLLLLHLLVLFAAALDLPHGASVVCIALLLILVLIVPSRVLIYSLPHFPLVLTVAVP